LRELISFCTSQYLLWEDCLPWLQTELGLESPPAVHGFPHTSHVVCTDFPDSRQSRWLFLTGGI